MTVLENVQMALLSHHGKSRRCGAGVTDLYATKRPRSSPVSA